MDVVIKTQTQNVHAISKHIS